MTTVKAEPLLRFLWVSLLLVRASVLQKDLWAFGVVAASNRFPAWCTGGSTPPAGFARKGKFYERCVLLWHTSTELVISTNRRILSPMRGAQRRGQNNALCSCILSTTTAKSKKTFDYKVAPQFAAYISTGVLRQSGFLTASDALRTSSTIRKVNNFGNCAANCGCVPRSAAQSFLGIRSCEPVKASAVDSVTLTPNQTRALFGDEIPFKYFDGSDYVTDYFTYQKYKYRSHYGL